MGEFKQVDIDAARIADCIKEGDLEIADAIFIMTCRGLNHWESIVLQDRVRALAGDSFPKTRPL